MSHCDLDIWRTNLKIHRVNARGTAYIQAMFRRKSLKNKRKWYNTYLKLLNRHFLFCVLVTLTFDLRTSKCIQLFYMSLSVDRLNLRPIGRKAPEKSCNASRTDFQRLSSRDLDLCPMTLQMHRYTVFANVYTPAKLHHDRMKNDREIATFGLSILCPCDLGL